MAKTFFKRMLAACLSAASVLTLLPAISAAPASALTFTPNCTVQSDSAVLLNLDLGEIVYEKNADTKEMPAAFVQIMTAVLVLENCNDISNTEITAGDDMYVKFTESEYPDDLRYAEIDPGNTLTVEDLLYAMMLTSSIEAAQMLVDEFGGDEKFTDMMNEKAEELGMADTRFTNGTGIYSARNATTARDMMTLVQYALTVPHFETISCSESYTPASAAEQEKEEDWVWTHSNLMTQESSPEYFYNGVRGIKTANSQEGGRCIACKASRDGNNYLVVCMNAPLVNAEGEKQYYHLEDAKNILDWAFIHLTFQEVLTESRTLGEIKVNNADGDDHVLLRAADSYSTIWNDTIDISAIQFVTDWPSEIDAPVEAGQKIGTVTLKRSGETLAVIDVLASMSVERSFWKYNLSEIPGFFRSKYLSGTLKLGIVLSVLYIGLCVFFAFRYHEERKKRAAARAGHLQKKN